MVDAGRFLFSHVVDSPAEEMPEIEICDGSVADDAGSALCS